MDLHFTYESQSLNGETHFYCKKIEVITYFIYFLKRKKNENENLM